MDRRKGLILAALVAVLGLVATVAAMPRGQWAEAPAHLVDGYPVGQELWLTDT